MPEHRDGVVELDQQPGLEQRVHRHRPGQVRESSQVDLRPQRRRPLDRPRVLLAQRSRVRQHGVQDALRERQHDASSARSTDPDRSTSPSPSRSAAASASGSRASASGGSSALGQGWRCLEPLVASTALDLASLLVAPLCRGRAGPATR